MRFAATRGWCSAELVGAVPTLHVYRLSEVPRGLTDDQIARAMRSVPADTEAGARDLAIIALLATYGVRRGQVTELRLSDIDWRARLVLFRAQKGGKAVRHVLTVPVAAVLGRYVERFRTGVSDDHVFLRAKAPRLPLSPTAVSVAVVARLKQAGVNAPLRSPHAFRHAFATRLLRTGRPLKDVADLLGHRHLGSAAIYGKVDLVALRRIAAEWPQVLR
ncbi:MAG: tyrosine-type recombinase/integrase [Planctomycetota bacterium]|nr:tyrosine-type recombinase/integrase [Planctomycetota bacterium]